MISSETKPLTAQQLYDGLMAEAVKVNREIAERLTGQVVEAPHQRLDVGDRMRISVELIRTIAADDPATFATAIVHVSAIVTETDGTKTLWLTKDPQAQGK